MAIAALKEREWFVPFNTADFAQACVQKLHSLESQVSEEMLFNVGYVIPFVELLEQYWLEHDIHDGPVDFLECLGQMVADAMGQDQMSHRDQELTQQVLDQLAQS